MHYLCAFNEEVLVNQIKFDKNSSILEEAYELFLRGENGHAVLSELVNRKVPLH